MRGTDYKKRIEKWNKNTEVRRYSFANVDGIFDKLLISNYVVARGTISIPSSEFPKKEEKKNGKKFSFTSLFLKRNFYFGALSSLLILLNVIVPLSAFEAHILNVTASIKQRTCTVATFENDASGLTILAGQILDNEYSDWGLTISADNNHAGVPDLAVAFNSDAPSGGDTDLGTPNGDFGGPGVGAGGASGEPGENNRLEHNLLVIAQDNVDSNGDLRVDDPSDEPDGGWVWFTFDAPTRVESLRLIDIETLGVKIDVYNAADILEETINVPSLGNNSSQYMAINKEGVKKIGVWLTGEGALDSLCFDPIEKPQICDARSKGYWANHEGCSNGNGESLWMSEVNVLSDSFFDIFATSTGLQICSALWTPNCPSGNTIPSRLCKAKGHLLADELNVVSGRLVLTALIAGAYDGDEAFSNLSLTPFSTVGQALGMIEAILADSNSTKKMINNAGYVAQRIYEFYENENPFRPQCVFDPEDVPQCLAPLNVNIEIKNDAEVVNIIETSSNTGGNSAGGGEIETGNATSTSEVTNIVNETIIDIPDNGNGTTTQNIVTEFSIVPLQNEAGGNARENIVAEEDIIPEEVVEESPQENSQEVSTISE